MSVICKRKGQTSGQSLWFDFTCCPPASTQELLHVASNLLPLVCPPETILLQRNVESLYEPSNLPSSEHDCELVRAVKYPGIRFDLICNTAGCYFDSSSLVFLVVRISVLVAAFGKHEGSLVRARVEEK
jgi:hypothetical protein